MRLVVITSTTPSDVLREWLQDLHGLVDRCEIWYAAGSQDHWRWSIEYAFKHEPGYTYWGSRITNASEVAGLFTGRAGVHGSSLSLVRHYGTERPNIVMFYVNGVGIIGVGLLTSLEYDFFELFWPEERSQGRVTFPFRYKMRVLWLHESVLKNAFSPERWNGIKWPLPWTPRVGLQRIDRDREAAINFLRNILPKTPLEDQVFKRTAEAVALRPTVAVSLEELSVAKVKEIADKHGLLYPDDVLAAVIAALKSGKHLLLMGPPGTGKSMLARVLAETLGFELYSCTASSTWTRYDFIGGPVIGEKGSLVWRSGHFLCALARHVELRSENMGGVLLLIEELNRCEADKVLAEFFSIYPSSDPNDWRLPEALLDEVRRYGGDEQVEGLLKYVKEHDNRVPPDFRIVATVNTFDRAYLFTLGHALQRRFVIVEVGPPSSREFEVDLVLRQLQRRGVREGSVKDFVELTVNIIWTLREIVGKDIGQGVTVDAAFLAYNMGEDDLKRAVEKAVILTVLSQIDLVPEDAAKVAEELRKHGYNLLAEAVKRLAA